jgi:hypothetical protein
MLVSVPVYVGKALTGGCGWQVLARMLDARQLGLKLIANVTYGYTSASFSGRMPCADVADAIVQTGRDTLQRVGRLRVLRLQPLVGAHAWRTRAPIGHGRHRGRVSGARRLWRHGQVPSRMPVHS